MEHAKTATERNTEHEAHNRKTLTDYCATRETAVWGGMTTSKHGVMSLPSTVSCSCGSTSGCSALTYFTAHAPLEPLNFRPRIQLSCCVVIISYFFSMSLYSFYICKEINSVEMKFRQLMKLIIPPEQIVFYVIYVCYNIRS